MHWYARWKLCYPKNEGGMGFRDFHSFNLAMLAKQVSRLIDEPESLCAKILKAKYYPHGNILIAGPKSGSSFTWQSVLAGLATFKRGYIWRVGNGDNIKIWDDPWIPASPSRKIVSPRGMAAYTRVSELISPITGQWDATKLNETFNVVDVTRILQIPINNQGFEDFIAWHFTPSGRYTVRSGYHIQWRHQFGALAGQLALLGCSVLNPVWKTVWQLKIPKKIKKFMWRVLHGILPLKSILANRHIGDSGGCPICNNGLEDIRHLQFICPTARQLWDSLGILHFIDSNLNVDLSGSAVLEHILRLPNNHYDGSPSTGLKELISVSSWYLWWIRRQHTHDEPVPTLYKCRMSVLAIVANAQAVATSGRLRSNRGEKWAKSEPRQIKINVDSSFVAVLGAGSTGAVARDYQGNFVAAATRYFPHVASLELAEAFAMRDGLQLAVKLGCSNVVAESDSIQVVQACTGEEPWWNAAATIFADCVDLVTNIGSVKFSHCLREANQVAHELAKDSFINRSSSSWMAEAPNFIVSNLINDVIIVNI